MILRPLRPLALLLLAAPSPAASGRETLVPLGATWKFLQFGSNPGSSWQAADADDSHWSAGRAELGFGDGDEATVISADRDASSKVATSYFRTSFDVANPDAYLGLGLRLLRDDGAVIYLNGKEVHRDNMPAGTIEPETLASAGVSGAAEKALLNSILAPQHLVRGRNTLAVEVHQVAATSSDLSFDLELVGLDAPSVTRGPYLLQGAPTSVIIRWRTDLATIGRVAYGTEPGALAHSAVEKAATTEHEVRLTGLTPETTYFYSIGTPSVALASGPDFTFTTSPPTGTPKPTRLWVLGDSGTKNANAAAVRTAYEKYSATHRADLVLMLGDNAYDAGTDAEYQAAVFDMYPQVLRRTVLWPTLGNHDTAQSPDPPLTIPYFQMFTLPVRGEAGGVASGTEKYYSFDYANIHFICLDSMTSSRAADGPMATWLKADLAGTLQPWIIAFWHHPPYTKGSHDSDRESNLVEMRQNMLPLLEAGGVDLVMAGHSHSYERSFLLHGHYGLSNSLAPEMKLDGGDGREQGTGAYRKAASADHAKGAVYITAGSSGQISGGPLNHPAMFISLNKLGSLVLDVHGPRLDARFLRENGEIDDSFTLLKDGSTR